MSPASSTCAPTWHGSGSNLHPDVSPHNRGKGLVEAGGGGGGKGEREREAGGGGDGAARDGTGAL